MVEGSCHCGAVRWSFDGTPESATACNCTVCRRYGVLWAYDFGYCKGLCPRAGAWLSFLCELRLRRLLA
jgi:hypothetical protein